jgi:autoinducer 2-degrading protein
LPSAAPSPQIVFSKKEGRDAVFVVYCEAQVKPEKVELYEQTFRDLKKKVHANEPGVVFYELCKDPQTPYRYRLFEAYRDAQVQQEHLDKDYYRAASPIIVSCLAGDHMEQIAKRGLTNPADVYPLITSLKMDVLETI